MPNTCWPKMQCSNRWDKQEQDFVSVYTTRLRDDPENTFRAF